MALKRISAKQSVEEILSLLDEDGGVVVEGMFPVAVIEQMRDDVMRVARDFEPGAATQGLGEAGKGFVGHNTIRFSSLGKVRGFM